MQFLRFHKHSSHLFYLSRISTHCCEDLCRLSVWGDANRYKVALPWTGEDAVCARGAHTYTGLTDKQILRSLRGIRQLRRLCKVVNIKRTIQRWVNAVDRNRVLRGDYPVGNTLHDIATWAAKHFLSCIWSAEVFRENGLEGRSYAYWACGCPARRYL